MAEETTRDGEEAVAACSECGANIFPAHRETVEDGDYRRIDCPECDNVEFRESFQARAESDSVFSETMQKRIEKLDKAGVMDDGPTVTPEVDASGVSVECSWDGCDSSPNDLDEGEGMRRTREDGLLCPEHFEKAVEQGHEIKYRREE